MVQDSLDKIVPEGNWYRHLDEGMDDMPAHVKVNAMMDITLFRVCRVMREDDCER